MSSITIKNNPNIKPDPKTLEQQQEMLTTVVDARMDVPQFDAQGHKEPNTKG